MKTKNLKQILVKNHLINEVSKNKMKKIILEKG